MSTTIVERTTYLLFHFLSVLSTFVTVSDGLLAQYRADLVRSPKRYVRGTIQAKMREADRWCTWAGDPWSANVHDVERWVGGLGLSASGTRDAVSHVRAFYRWAIRHEHTSVDPTATVDLPRAARRLPRPAADRVVDVAIRTATPPMRAMLALMAGAGLRCCEVAALRWSDVDMIEHRLHVTGKYDRERVLTVSRQIVRALAAIDHGGAYVFVGARGRPYSPCRVSQLVNEHLRLIGAGCTAHQFRHRFATRALADCGQLAVVRDLLGHSTVAVTEIYAEVTPGIGAAVSAAVDVPGLT